MSHSCLIIVAIDLIIFCSFPLFVWLFFLRNDDKCASTILPPVNMKIPLPKDMCGLSCNGCMGEKYPMGKTKSAQIDCRKANCAYHVNAECTNIAPAITLDESGPTGRCWSQSTKEVIDD